MIKRFIVITSLALLLAASPANRAIAQDTPPPRSDASETASASRPDAALQSPRATMRTFTTAMAAWEASANAEDLARAVECLDLSGVLSADEVGPRLARRLYETMQDLRMGLDPFSAMLTIPREFPSRDELPDGADRDVREITPDFGAERATPVRFLFRKNNKGEWLIARTTVEWFDAKHAELHPNPIERLARDWGMEWAVSGSLLGMKYYLWMAIFAVILIGVVIDFVVREFVRVATRRVMHKDDPDTDAKEQNKSARKAAKPFGMAAGGLTVYLLLDLLELPAIVEGILRTGAKAFAMAAAIWSAYRLVDVASDHAMHRAKQTRSSMDDLMIPLVRKAVKIFIVAFGLVFIAEAFSLPITSLVAGLGIGGLAFAFAAKDTIENLFGSVSVILDRPFTPGDWVVVDDIEGTVEEVGFRSTRVRTFYNSLVTVPNAILVRAKVDNYGRRRYRRFRTHLSLTYATDPARIEQFCEGIRELIRKHPSSRKDYYEVHLHQFSAASIDVLVYMFFQTPDWSSELAARHAFMLDIIRLAKRVGVDFAFPTQTLHLFNETGTPAIEPKDVPALDRDALRSQGRSAADAISGQ